MMTHFGGLAQEGWPLPPRGISIARTNHRAGVLIQYTFLCDSDDTCLAIAYSQDSELHARQQIDGHVCPQLDGSRALIPTGKTLVQKMWDEADDAMDAFKDCRGYKGLSEDSLTGFIRGIAEVLTFCTVPCFKVTDDVLREINRRWKMRDGQIPFAPTPSYSYHPHLDDARARSITKDVEPKPAAKTTRPSIRQVAKAAEPAEVQLGAAARQIIRNTYHDGTLEKSQAAEMLAGMYGISVERVKAIAGTEMPKTDGVFTSTVLF